MAKLTIELDDALVAQLESLRHNTGQSIQDLIRDGLSVFVSAQALTDWAPTASDFAAVEEGRADFAAGRTVSQDAVDAEMSALLEAP